MSLARAGPSLACLAALAATLRCGGGGDGRRAVVVESTAPGAVQAAVDAAPDGGTVFVPPGVYTESLRIEGRRVTVEGIDAGRGAAEIVAADRARPVVEVGLGGEVTLRGLRLRGGSEGVAGVRDGSGLVADVTLARVTVHDVNRGVYGTFGTLRLEDAEVHSTVGNGLSLLDVVDLTLVDTFVHDTGGVGLYVDNHGAPGVVVVSGSSFAFNPFGGILVDGHGKSVLVADCTITLTGGAGIWLLDAGPVLVLDTVVTLVGPTNEGKWGDGILAYSSDPVTILGCTVTQCERAAIVVSGCDPEHHGSCSMADTHLEDCTFGMALVKDASLVVCSDSGPGHEFEDLGGNTCLDMVGSCFQTDGPLPIPNTPVPIPAGP